jgi:1,4-dihydroxy-2-naphthoate octaprenyltransferase
MANEQIYEHNLKEAPTVEGRRHLSKKWWIVLVVLGFLAWALFAAMGLVPLWLWMLTIATPISVALAIALFAPRRAPR